MSDRVLGPQENELNQDFAYLDFHAEIHSPCGLGEPRGLGGGKGENRHFPGWGLVFSCGLGGKTKTIIPIPQSLGHPSERVQCLFAASPLLPPQCWNWGSR
jgi:hypothetical protein